MLTTLLLIACAPVKPEIGDDPYAATTFPDIVVDASVLDFGVLRAGASAEATLGVANEGDADLSLDLPVLQDPYGAYSMSVPDTATLAPGETATLVLTFAPDASGTQTGSLLVRSDDPDEPSIEIALIGTAADPSTAIDPAGHSFGAVPVGCTDLQGFTVANPGDVALVVEGLEIAGGEGVFTVDADEQANGALPWSLGPMESRVVWVTFAPARADSYSGSLVVRTDDPENPTAAAGLDGSGLAVAEIVEPFVASGGTVDVLFAVDGNTSMTSERSDLADALPTFVDALDGYAMDYQVAAVVESDGCVVGEPYVSDETAPSSRDGLLVDMIDDADPSSLHGLDLIERATDPDLTDWGECNEGLVRGGDALLVVVGFTDGGEATSQGWNDYSDLLDERARSWEIDLVAPGEGTCYGSAGTVWEQALRDDGGDRYDLCDVAGALDDLAADLVDVQTVYPLSGTPQIDTLEVRVEGTVVSGWVYDAGANTVTFPASGAPEAGSDVEIAYDAAPECST